jgi:hypothetical protein
VEEDKEGLEGIGDGETEDMGEVLRVGEVGALVEVGSIDMSIDPRREMCTFGCCCIAVRHGKVSDVSSWLFLLDRILRTLENSQPPLEK